MTARYGGRGQASGNPGGGQERFVLAVLVPTLVIGALLLVAGVLDGFVFAGHGLPLQGHNPLTTIVLVIGHPMHPLRAWGPGHGGLGANPLAYWTLYCLLVAVLVYAGVTARRVLAPQVGPDDAGFARSAHVAHSASLKAALARRDQTRPDLAGRPNKTLKSTDVGYSLGHTLTSGRHELIASWEASMQLVGPPGCGKTARVLLPILRHHPGPAIVTSTKVDIYEASALTRQSIGPVAVLDPEGMAPGAPRVRWSPVRGCEDTRTAERRAVALIAGSGASHGSGGNHGFFKASATGALKAFLHAAALGDKSIADVLRWCRGETTEPLDILDTRGDRLLDVAGQLRQHTTGAVETTSGVLRMVENTLACFSHRETLDLCMPSVVEEFDMVPFIEQNGTVYLLGSGDEHSSTSALTTVFAEEMLFVAGNRVAPATPFRRLSPPLLACLDEAPSIAPLPSLPRLLADGRGRGIVTVFAMQSFSQARTRWSDDEAETMTNAATITATFGGLAVTDDLETLAKLSGRRHYLDTSSHMAANHSGASSSASWREEDVLRSDQIRTLDDGHMLIFFDKLPPVIAELPLIYTGRDSAAIADEVASLRNTNDNARLATQRGITIRT